jgi:hypothetical protein
MVATLPPAQALQFVPKQRQQSAPANAQVTLVGGFDFWFVAGIVFVKDMFDIGFAVVGTAVGLTGVGLVITFMLFFINFILNLFLYVLMITFFITTGISFNTKKIATLSTSLIMEQVPLLNCLPLGTLSFFMIRFIENSERRGGAAGKMGAILGKIAHAK